MLRFRDLGISFSNLKCFVFESWVLRASVFVFECFVFETAQPSAVYSRLLHGNFNSCLSVSLVATQSQRFLKFPDFFLINVKFL